MDRRTFVSYTTLSLGLGAAASRVEATEASYPSRYITLVYPWPPGGPGDVISRLYAMKMGQRLGQSVVVDTRPGATGAIGMSAAARAAADGYTLALASVDTQAINPNFNNKVPYKPLEDFVAVGGAGRVPMTLCVSGTSEYKDAKALVAAAKKSPGTLTYSTWGNGSLAHVAMANLAHQVGMDMLHVPYQGAAPALTGLLGGQVDATVLPLNMAAANAAGGKLRILGTMTTTRVEPDIPCLTEQGFASEVYNWFGIVAPAKTSKAQIERLSKETMGIVSDPEFVATLKKNSIETFPASAQDFQSFMQAENARWKKIMADRKIVQS